MGELETFIFGRARKPEEGFGIHLEIYAAKSTDDEILKKGQDGGVDHHV
jgi:coenzyme F420-reducing hydrogenase beta subunit